MEAIICTYQYKMIAFLMSCMCSAEWPVYAELPPIPLYPATHHARPYFRGTHADISSSLAVWRATPASPQTHDMQLLHGTSHVKCGMPVQ